MLPLQPRSTVRVLAIAALVCGAGEARAQQPPAADTAVAPVTPGRSPRPHPLLALVAGSGSMQFDCHNCAEWRGSSAPMLELQGGLRVNTYVSVLASLGAAFTSGRVDTDVTWRSLGARIHPPQVRGFYLEPALAIINGTMNVYRFEPCPDADMECALGAILTLGLSRRHKVNLARAGGADFSLAAGYELKLGSGASLTPQFRWMLGQAGVNGFSVGLTRTW